MRQRDIQDLTVVGYSRTRCDEPRPAIVISSEWVEYLGTATTVPGERFRTLPRGSKVLTLRPKAGSQEHVILREQAQEGATTVICPTSVMESALGARFALSGNESAFHVPPVPGWTWEAISLQYLTGTYGSELRDWIKQEEWIRAEQERMLADREHLRRRLAAVHARLGVRELRRVDMQPTQDPGVVVALSVLEGLLADRSALEKKLRDAMLARAR